MALLPPKHAAIHAPQSSPALQMPRVVVHPPEEEQENQPWCCFDAAEPPPQHLSTTPDLANVNFALYSISGFRIPEDLVMPRKKLQASKPGPQHDSPEEFDAEPQNVCESDCPDPQIEPEEEATPSADVGNDSIVVEVIKVRRGNPYAEMPNTLNATRPKSFRSRASNAIRSIRNVGKKSHHRAPSVKGTPWSPQSSTQHSATLPTSHRSRTPQLGKQSTLALSQLFMSPKLDRSSGSSHEKSPTLSEEEASSLPENGHASADRISLEKFDLANRPSLPQPPKLDHLSTEDMPHENRAPSPVLSTSTYKQSGQRRLFSALDLHRLFSFSSSSTQNGVNASEDSQPDLEAAPHVSQDASSSSTSSAPSSAELPSTPTDDMRRPFVIPDSLDSSPFTLISTPLGTSSPASSFSRRTPSLSFPPTSFLRRSPSFPPSPLSKLSSNRRKAPYDAPLPPSPTPCSLPLPASPTTTARTRSTLPRNKMSTGSEPSMDEMQHGHDLSFEMRLDSLHFDSLSFDLDHF